MSKKPVSFVMNEKEWKDLEIYAKNQKTSVSTIIRQAIHEKIESETNKKQANE